MSTEQKPEPRKLLYFHDPMCSWCWGFGPALHALMAELPGDIQVVRILGGLAPDSDQPMPEEMRQHLQQAWKRIQVMVPGTRFNFDFWTECEPRRSTYPACRAVIAARRQGEDYDLTMTEAIQHAYYQEARNPSDVATLADIAESLGLDRERFERDLESDEVNQTLMVEINAAREMGIQGFPSLLLIDDQQARRVAIDHNNPQSMLDQVQPNSE